jgi:hypothetical protein
MPIKHHYETTNYPNHRPVGSAAASGPRKRSHADNTPADGQAARHTGGHAADFPEGRAPIPALWLQCVAGGARRGRGAEVRPDASRLHGSHQFGTALVVLLHERHSYHRQGIPGPVPYFGWSGPFGGGGLFVSAYSPIMLTTTHVLDAAVKTVNALHHQAPFNFGIVLGDVCNASQFNELRWFIDVMDGQRSRPVPALTSGPTRLNIRSPIRPSGSTAPSLGMRPSATTISSGWVSATRLIKCETPWSAARSLT